jgi:hypothetical protein
MDISNIFPAIDSTPHIWHPVSCDSCLAERAHLAQGRLQREDEPIVPALLALIVAMGATRRRAKGLWIGRFAEPDAGLHTEGGSRIMGRCGLGSRISSLSGLRRSRQESRFEAVPGKTPRTEFRGGGGNVVQGLVTFCHAARKGGYAGSHWPTHWRAFSLLDD